MGIVSKRKASGQQTEARRDERRYKAGIYARLSSDQDVKKNESVEVQVEIAKKFVEEFNGQKNGEVIDVVECYTDLGKTGSNFEREGFLRLLQDIRLGEINCVIVKDLSRFGRNYLEECGLLQLQMALIPGKREMRISRCQPLLRWKSRTL